MPSFAERISERYIIKSLKIRSGYNSLFILADHGRQSNCYRFYRICRVISFHIIRNVKIQGLDYIAFVKNSARIFSKLIISPSRPTIPMRKFVPPISIPIVKSNGQSPPLKIAFNTMLLLLYEILLSLCPKPFKVFVL